MQAKPKILVVDDDATNILVLESILKRAGYHTITASDGKSALELAQTELPDLILLDIMMPLMDGFEVCKRLNGISKTTDIPVIFLSALDDVDSKVMAFDVGAVDYVGKPFHKPEVLARVRLHLKLSFALKMAVAAQTEKFKQLHDAQQAILVAPEDIPDAQFAVCYNPLHEAGGDFYDVFNISDNIFGYFVADISGHDMGASFTTPAIKVLLAQHANLLNTPVETLKNMNSVLSKVMSDGNHITASYVQINRNAGRLQVVSAGHPPVLYVQGNGEYEFLALEGDVLGVFDSVCFDPIEMPVSKGDRLFMYSDGLIESFADNTKITRKQGLDRLAQAVMDNMSLPINQAADHILSDVVPADALLEDDIVLMGVEI